MEKHQRYIFYDLSLIIALAGFTNLWVMFMSYNNLIRWLQNDCPVKMPRNYTVPPALSFRHFRKASFQTSNLPLPPAVRASTKPQSEVTACRKNSTRRRWDFFYRIIRLVSKDFCRFSRFHLFCSNSLNDFALGIKPKRVEFSCFPCSPKACMHIRLLPWWKQLCLHIKVHFSLCVQWL